MLGVNRQVYTKFTTAFSSAQTELQRKQQLSNNKSGRPKNRFPNNGRTFYKTVILFMRLEWVDFDLKKENSASQRENENKQALNGKYNGDFTFSSVPFL